MFLDSLEQLVEFIIKKSYFFEIFKNVRTETNEIDEVIVLTTFFELIKAKKLEMQMVSDYNNFIKDNKHSAEDEVKKIVGRIR